MEQVSVAASGSSLITETPATGPTNNLPVGIYLITFLETDKSLSNPSNTVFMGTCVLTVNSATVSNVTTYTLASGVSVGDANPGVTTNKVYLSITSTTASLVNSTSAPVGCAWKICKLI